NKMTREELEALIMEYPLPQGWIARVPELQEPANYGTNWETWIYEEQVRLGYRLHLHPFALRMFDHYKMAPGQLMPNGWKNLVGIVYLIETSGYKADPTDFMRVFFEICFVKGVANCPGWYYIHSRQRLLKKGLKFNKGWHSRYFFAGLEKQRKFSFGKTWNAYCKDFENKNRPLPDTSTKHILSHIKLRGGFSIDEPLTDQQLVYEKIIPRKPIPAGLPVNLPPLVVLSTSSTETEPLGRWQLWKAGRKEKLLPKLKEPLDVQRSYPSMRLIFLLKNVRDEWLKKRTGDSLEIYELGFNKAKGMFAQRFPDTPLDGFVVPAYRSHSRETVPPSEAEDATSQAARDECVLGKWKNLSKDPIVIRSLPLDEVLWHNQYTDSLGARHFLQLCANRENVQALFHEGFMAYFINGYPEHGWELLQRAV
ncbi:hypothetical protein RJ640_027669, partial [Escallonia rubra]